MNVIIFSCENHMDEALDDFINESACPPDIVLCQDLEGIPKDRVLICSYCTQAACFLIKKVGTRFEV